jgi:hypothetical protein
MDPNVVHEQPGMGSAAGHPENGADHLRRLKAQLITETIGNASAAATLPGALPTLQERRRSPRFQCSGSIELHIPGSDVRVWGTLTDISLHGCYVEMPTTFPVDTEVSLNIESLGVRVSTRAKVRATYPSLGMGMCFCPLEPAQQAQLGQLLKMVTGQHRIGKSVVPVAPAVSPDMNPNIFATADPQLLLDHLKEYFKANGLLSRDEFFAIAKRARRS